MSNKKLLKVIRLEDYEMKKVEQFLRLNRIFENFSSLVRVALLDFITKEGRIDIQPIVQRGPKKRKDFLWDYDLEDAQIREILNGPQSKRLWLVARILEHAKFEQIWEYLTLADIKKDLNKLRLPDKIKKHWEYALKRWGV